MGTLSSLSTLVLQDYNLIWAVLIRFLKKEITAVSWLTSVVHLSTVYLSGAGGSHHGGKLSLEKFLENRVSRLAYSAAWSKVFLWTLIKKIGLNIWALISIQWYKNTFWILVSIYLYFIIIHLIIKEAK